MSWNPVVTTEKDFPVAYGCEFTGSPPNVSTATLAFNYEFSVLNERGEDLRMVVIELRREMLPKLEVNFLYGLMEKTGLKECDFVDKQNIVAYAPSDESISFDPPPYVISLTSFAMDYIVPDETCDHLMPMTSSFDCFHVNGEMNADYIGGEEHRDSVIKFLSVELDQIMANYTRWTIPGLTEFHLIQEAIPGEDQSGSSSSQSSTNAGVIGGTVTAGAILLLCVAGFVFHRRRTRRANEQANAKHEIIMDIEPTGAPDTTESEHPDVAKAAATADVENQKDPTAGDRDQEVPSSDSLPAPAALAALRTLSTATATDDSELLETQSKEPPEDEIKTTTADTSSTITPPPAAAEQVKICTDPPPTRETISPSPVPMVDLLPPKPPTDPSSKAHLVAAMSKPLKVRRKKKKRKKKTKMARVNSRENIKEMETITEGGEESEGSDDDGSEYSWCSTSDSNASSRQSSPSQSRGGSRDASPARLSHGEDSPIPSLAGSWDNGSGNGSGESSLSDRKKAEQLPPYLV